MGRHTIGVNVLQMNMPEEAERRKPTVRDIVRQIGVDEFRYTLPLYTAASILVYGTTQLLVAPPKAGKSFIAVELAWSVATGERFLGKYDIDVPGPVLYIAGEGSHETHSRFEVLLRRKGNTLKHPLYLYPQPINIGAVGATKPLRQFAIEEGVKLIIIDTASRCGAGDEESRDMVSFVDGLRELQEVGATQLVLHHTPKSDAKQSRGHSSLPAAVDSQWTVQAKSDGTRTLQEEFGRTSTSAGTVLGEFRIEGHVLGINEHGRAISTGFVSMLDRDAKRLNKRIELVELVNSGMSIRAAAERCGVTKSTAIRWMQDERDIEDED